MRDLGYELRIALVRILSPRGLCAACGAQHDAKDLEIDHVDGREVLARTMSRVQRAKLYWTEWLAGVRLRALCRSCNAIDGTRRQWAKKETRAA